MQTDVVCMILFSHVQFTSRTNNMYSMIKFKLTFVTACEERYKNLSINH